MASKILMRHIAATFDKKVSDIQAKMILLWHNNDIASISIKQGPRRLCHIALGLLDHIHVDGFTFDLKDYNSCNDIIKAIETKLNASLD